MVASGLLIMLATLPVIYLRTLSKHTETWKESDSVSTEGSNCKQPA